MRNIVGVYYAPFEFNELEIYRGDEATFTFTLRDKNKNILSLEGASIELIVKSLFTQGDNDPETVLISLKDASLEGGADDQILIEPSELRSSTVFFTPTLTDQNIDTYRYVIRVAILGDPSPVTVVDSFLTINPTVFPI